MIKLKDNKPIPKIILIFNILFKIVKFTLRMTTIFKSIHFNKNYYLIYAVFRYSEKKYGVHKKN